MPNGCGSVFSQSLVFNQLMGSILQVNNEKLNRFVRLYGNDTVRQYKTALCEERGERLNNMQPMLFGCYLDPHLQREFS